MEKEKNGLEVHIYQRSNSIYPSSDIKGHHYTPENQHRQTPCLVYNSQFVDSFSCTSTELN